MTYSGRAVFLSYASQDAKAAQHLCEALRAAGVEVWFDQSELRGGDAWDSLIRKQIKACYLFVPMISANTQSREEGYFRREWKIAVDRTNDMAGGRAFLLPIVIDGTSDSDALVPEKFRDVQWTRLAAGANTDAFLDHVRRLLSPDAGVPAIASVRKSELPTSSPVAPSARLSLSSSRSVAPWIVGGLLILGAGYFVADKFHLFKHAVPVAEAAREKSIAVLPFVDMSEKKDQEYFSDGLSEELINMLTTVSGLRVVARTSSFFFKGKQVALRDIADALGVSHVLEGSVRKSGNRLRIVAQLIDTQSDAHLWSQTYDRELTDVFAVQDEISAAVVSQLKITLLGGAPKSKTTDPKAYSLFLEGRQYARQFTKEGFERSIALYKQALELDPQYAAAWDGLAQDYINQTINGLRRPASEGYGLARAAANHAIAIQPELASAHSRLGTVAMNSDGDFAIAAKHYARAMTLGQFNTNIIGNAAGFAARLGRLDTAIALQKYTNAHDPQNGIGHQNLGYYYLCAGRPDEALIELREALRLNPKRLEEHLFVGRALLSMGDPKAALAEIQQEGNEEDRLFGLAMAHFALGQKSESDAALNALIKNGEVDYVPGIFAFRGETDRLFEWFRKLPANRSLRGLDFVTGPEFEKLRDDPRWLAFLREMGQSPEQLAAIEFDVKVPD